MQIRLVVIGALVLGALAPSSAMGQSAAPSAPLDAREKARQLADEGLGLYNAGKYQEALAKLREADKHFSAPTIRLMIAKTHDKMGKLIEAREIYRSILNEKLVHYAPPVFFEAQAEAKRELDALTPRIPTLQVVVQGVPTDEVQVTLDGASVKLDRPLERDPGRYVIVASSTGREPFTQVVRLKERATASVTVAFAPAPKVAPAAPLASRFEHVPQGARSPNALMISGITLTGALASMGVAFFAMGVSVTNEGNAARSSALYLGRDLERAQLMNLGFWSFVGAGVAGASTLGYVLWSSRSDSDSKVTAGMQWQPGGGKFLVTGAM